MYPRLNGEPDCREGRGTEGKEQESMSVNYFMNMKIRTQLQTKEDTPRSNCIGNRLLLLKESKDGDILKNCE